MNERQKAFCDNYISNGGNATQAAIDAGYSAKTAGSIGNENLKKPEISAYIEERMRPTADKRIMTAEEILLQLSATARRENTESVVVVTKKETVSYDSNGRKVIVKTETPEVVQIPAKISDANKAAELLGKYRAIWDGQGKETTSNGILEALQALMEKRK
jgi:phage terminase small subunit